MQRTLTTSIMRPHQPPNKPRHTTTEHHPPQPLRLHSRKAQLRKQESGTAVRAPRGLEGLDGDVGGGGYAGVAEGGAGVVEEDGGVGEGVCDLGVEAADLISHIRIPPEAR